MGRNMTNDGQDQKKNKYVAPVKMHSEFFRILEWKLVL